MQLKNFTTNQKMLSFLAFLTFLKWIQAQGTGKAITRADTLEEEKRFDIVINAEGKYLDKLGSEGWAIQIIDNAGDGDQSNDCGHDLDISDVEYDFILDKNDQCSSVFEDVLEWTNLERDKEYKYIGIIGSGYNVGTTNILNALTKKTFGSISNANGISFHLPCKQNTETRDIISDAIFINAPSYTKPAPKDMLQSEKLMDIIIYVISDLDIETQTTLDNAIEYVSKHSNNQFKQLIVIHNYQRPTNVNTIQEYIDRDILMPYKAKARHFGNVGTYYIHFDKDTNMHVKHFVFVNENNALSKEYNTATMEMIEYNIDLAPFNPNNTNLHLLDSTMDFLTNFMAKHFKSSHDSSVHAKTQKINGLQNAYETFETKVEMPPVLKQYYLNQTKISSSNSNAFVQFSCERVCDINENIVTVKIGTKTLTRFDSISLNERNAEMSEIMDCKMFSDQFYDSDNEIGSIWVLECITSPNAIIGDNLDENIQFWVDYNTATLHIFGTIDSGSKMLSQIAQYYPKCSLNSDSKGFFGEESKRFIWKRYNIPIWALAAWNDRYQSLENATLTIIIESGANTLNSKQTKGYISFLDSDKTNLVTELKQWQQLSPEAMILGSRKYSLFVSIGLTSFCAAFIILFFIVAIVGNLDSNIATVWLICCVLSCFLNFYYLLGYSWFYTLLVMLYVWASATAAFILSSKIPFDKTNLPADGVFIRQILAFVPIVSVLVLFLSLFV